MLKTEKVEFAIQNKITTEGFKIGDKIPSIRDLAQLCNVSVGSANQATLSLVEKSILEKKPTRKGLFVAKIPKKCIERKLNGIAVVYESLEQYQNMDTSLVMNLLERMNCLSKENEIECTLVQ